MLLVCDVNSTKCVAFVRREYTIILKHHYSIKTVGTKYYISEIQSVLDKTEMEKEEYDESLTHNSHGFD